ncbi:MAG: hypothetical protein E3J94_04945 [Desulfobacteraceae bacterium]|nr:MAG: hypothetical protein E3J94_04945 [Desulfobacteraceae bacterium]
MAEVTEQESMFDHPIFQESSRAEVKAKWKAGEYSKDEVLMYKAGVNVREVGFFNLDRVDVKTLYKQGHVPRAMAAEYKNYHDRGVYPASWAGTYMLEELAKGRSQDDVAADMGGITFSFYDPIDLFLDATTLGIASGVRASGKLLKKPVVEGIKALTKAVTGVSKKKLAKEAATSVGLGAVAGGSMTLVDKLGGGTLSTLLSGLVSPMGAHALTAMSRRAFISLITTMRRQNPKLAGELKNAVMSSESKAIAHLRAAFGELDDAEVGLTKFTDLDPGFADLYTGLPMGKTKIVDPTASLEAEKVAKGLKFKAPGAGQQITPEPLTKVQAMDILKKAKSGEGEGEVLKQFGEGKGSDLAAAIHEIHKPTIDKARGGHVPRKLTEQEGRKFIKDNYTALADQTGKRVIDVEKALGGLKEVQDGFQNISAKISGFNDIYKTMLKEIEPGLKKTDLTFTEEMALAKQIMGMAEFTEAIYGIRAEFGRGLGMYNRMFRKMPYALDNIPQHEFEMVEKATRGQVRQYLKAFKKASGLKAKINIARDTHKFRFLKGALESMQGSLLWHPATQIVNITGNTLAYGTETLGRYAGISFDAWKLAGGLRKPLSFDNYRMQEIYYDVLSHRTAFSALFNSPKKVVKVVKASKSFQEFAKNLETEEVGTFYKALLSGEAQIDPFYKIEGQAEKAFENMFFFKYKNKTYKVPDALTKPIGGFFRIPFKGLTAMDEAFKTVAIHQKVSSLLFRQGLTDGAVNMKQYIKAGVQNMASDNPMYLKALKAGRKATFTDELGTLSRPFERLLSSGRFGLVTKILALPFFKVLVNLNKYALKNTPIGLLSKDIVKTLKHGSVADKAEIYAKWAMGMTAVIGGAMLYESGKITGRTPRSQYAAWKNAKAQDYSWVDTDDDNVKTYTDYNRFDPYSSLVGVGADLALALDMTHDLVMDEKTEDEFDEALKDTLVAFGVAFVEPFLNKTFTQSANEVAKFALQTERTDVWKFTEKQTRKFYPRLIDLTNQITQRDDVVREIRNPIDGFFAKFDPKRLPPKRHNVYGTIQRNDPRCLGIVSQKISDDPIMDEMMKLGMSVRPIPRKMLLAGESKKLTPQQYDKLCQGLEDEDIKGMLQSVMDTTGYKESTSDEFKTRLLNIIIRDTRLIAKAKFMASEFGVPVTKLLLQQLSITEAAMMGKLERPHKIGRFYKFLKKE